MRWDADVSCSWMCSNDSCNCIEMEWHCQTVQRNSKIKECGREEINNSYLTRLICPPGEDDSSFPSQTKLHALAFRGSCSCQFNDFHTVLHPAADVCISSTSSVQPQQLQELWQLGPISRSALRDIRTHYFFFFAFKPALLLQFAHIDSHNIYYLHSRLYTLLHYSLYSIRMFSVSRWHVAFSLVSSLWSYESKMTEGLKFNIT